jgi:hypothetical protein
VPLDPVVTWIQPLFEVAVHEHAAVVLTHTEPPPPLGPNDSDVGEIV